MTPVHLPEAYSPKRVQEVLTEVRRAGSAVEQFPKTLLLPFSFDFVQHQFERLRPYPKIRAKGTIENADSEEDQSHARSQGTNGKQV
jgi:hypothetical protein